MKKIVLFAMGLVMSMTTFAQDELTTTVSADVVNQYIWRGQELGGTSFSLRLASPTRACR